MNNVKTHYTNAFFIGVGVGHIIEKYKGDFWGGLREIIIEHQRQVDIENRRIVDVMGDTLGYKGVT